MTCGHCSGDGSLESHCFSCRPSLLDAEVLAEVTSRFPLVRIVDIDTGWDWCSGCPDLDPHSPADAVAVIVVTRFGRPERTPVCAGCLEIELGWATSPHRTGVSEVELHVMCEPAMEGAAA